MPIDENDPENSTKVYYYLDDNTPYLSVIPVAESAITLGDFKKIFTRKGYKYFCKQLDKTIGCEVKVELRDDSSKLQKSANGLIELVLLSTITPSAGAGGGTLPRNIPSKKMAAIGAEDRCQLKDQNLRKRRSLHDLATNALLGVDRETAATAATTTTMAMALNNGIGRNSIRTSNEDSITASSLSTVISKRAGEGLADLYTSNSEDPYRFDESNSRFTINSEACSSTYGGVPAIPLSNLNALPKTYRQRRPRKERYRKAYVPSTISSVTESRSVDVCIIHQINTRQTISYNLTSLSLPRIDVIKLPMTNGAFLGISVLSHDGGIFVSEIIKGGAVALDGRLEIGDQIVQVNRNSFENLSDAQAVQLLRQAAISRRPITLYVAKRPCHSDNRSDLLSGLASETLPIDISLWVESAKQNTVKPLKPFAIDESNSALDDNTLSDEQIQLQQHEADLEGLYVERTDRNVQTVPITIGAPPHTAVTCRAVQKPPHATIQNPAGKTPQLLNAEDVARRRENEENEQLVDSLNVNMDPIIILKYMARPDSGLQIKNRKWLKIPVPMSFIGRELVDWLLDHVHGLHDRKAARNFASKLLADGHIRHVVNKLTFTEKCYYIFDESILSSRLNNQSDSPTGKTGAEATTEVTYVGSPAPLLAQRLAVRNANTAVTVTPLTTYNNLPTDIDQTWPLSPITVCGGATQQQQQQQQQRRKDCDSPVTNDYASVIGPDVITSTMIGGASLTEAPTLKLPRHGCNNERRGMLLSTRRRHDDEIIATQPPNTPSSLSMAPQNTPDTDSETDFETIPDQQRKITGKETR